jgi:ribonuclease D
MTRWRPLRGVRTRLLLVVLAAVTVALAAATIGFNLLLVQSNADSADALLSQRADSERAQIAVDNGKVQLAETQDDAIGDIAVQAPTSIEKLKHLRSLPKGFERSRWGEAIIDAVKRGLERDPDTLPGLDRFRPAPNGAATVELLKVLLRMTAERHGVAAKVIATVDELDRIAASDDADVPALKGWRRELFGEKALALKHGKLALAVEKGRVVTVEKS